MFGDNWSLAFFGAVTPVAALFVFERRKNMVYEAPGIEFLALDTADVISTSPTTPPEGELDTEM